MGCCEVRKIQFKNLRGSYMNEGNSLTITSKKTVLSVRLNLMIEIIILLSFIYWDLYMGNYLFKIFPGFMTKVSAHMGDLLFNTIPDKLHLYFCFLLFIGFPIVFIFSLVFSLLFYSKRKSIKFLLILLSPMFFIILIRCLSLIPLLFL